MVKKILLSLFSFVIVWKAHNADHYKHSPNWSCKKLVLYISLSYLFPIFMSNLICNCLGYSKTSVQLNTSTEIIIVVVENKGFPYFKKPICGEISKRSWEQEANPTHTNHQGFYFLVSRLLQTRVLIHKLRYTENKNNKYCRRNGLWLNV